MHLCSEPYRKPPRIKTCYWTLCFSVFFLRPRWQSGSISAALSCLVRVPPYVGGARAPFPNSFWWSSLVGSTPYKFWKRSLIYTVRRTVHSYPSRKRSFLENALQTGGIWKRRLRKQEISITSQWCDFPARVKMTDDNALPSFSRVVWTENMMHFQGENTVLLISPAMVGHWFSSVFVPFGARTLHLPQSSQAFYLAEQTASPRMFGLDLWEFNWDLSNVTNTTSPPPVVNIVIKKNYNALWL